jgi:hypothetical protein
MQAYLPALLLLVLGLQHAAEAGASLPEATQRGALDGGVAGMALLPPGTEMLGLQLLSALWGEGPLLRLLHRQVLGRLREMQHRSPKWAALAFWALQVRCSTPGARVCVGAVLCCCVQCVGRG